jgi:hypothetical protein
VGRRVVSVGSLVLAVAALAVVLANATLVDRRPPSVSAIALSAPVEGQAAIALTLTAIDVQFSEPVRTVSVERRFTIQPRVGGTLTWEGSTATFTPSAKLPPDTEFTVSIEPGYEDLAGNVATAAAGPFTFRTVGPPAVVAATPADNADAVPVDATLSLEFDRLMDTVAVEEAITIEPSAPVRPAWSGRTLTIAFDAPLAFGTTYTLTLGTGAADTDGSRLAAPFRTTFRTVDAGLAVVETLPRANAAGISVRAPIAIVFDAPVDVDSIAGAITVTPAVAGDVRVVSLPSDAEAPRPDVADGGTVVLLQPSEPLAAHTTYTVSLGPVVARAGAPDQVAPARTWTFTTGQPTTSAHNHLAFLSTRSGSRQVWLMNPDGSAPRQLTTGLAGVTGFDVALDGSLVAWSAGGEVRTMAIDGGGETVLTADGRFEYAPRFSPSGRSLLVARRAADGTDEGWWLVPIAGGDEGERQVLASGAPPLGSTTLEGDGIGPDTGLPPWAGRAAFDPEGRWLLLTTAPGDVQLVDLAATDPAAAVIDTRLTALAGGAWSPSGAQFVIVGRDDGATADGLYTVDTAGTARRRADATGSLAAAGDGRVALLVPGAGGTTHVALGDVEGDEPPLALTDDPARADRWPTFSPDGQVVVFGRVTGADGTTSAGIWTVPRSGGEPVALTTDGAYPRWLP